MLTLKIFLLIAQIACLGMQIRAGVRREDGTPWMLGVFGLMFLILFL